ncbi:MAG: hypothetical protein OEV49_02440 [candidate division Zixibacteria bacterium]|nr:hypothetical protein [candidate division Zixibacteria bacterium]MDH3937331.1 hypothetical protein [candidate division Zixibacteria bacterium]MDH4033521.1 hypothetical protein [candidate division Zixibacteria bacterium]
MALKFTKSTDSEHEVKLNSELISVTWTCGLAIGGQSAAFQVQTEMVGEGAPIKVKGNSEKGKSLGNLSGVVRRNSFSGAFDIPEDIELGDKVFFEAKLPKNSLEGESEHIPAYPPIRVTNLAWSDQQARRGDTLTLTADIKGLPNETKVEVMIYEYHPDAGPDRVTSLPTKIEDEKVEVRWQYDYFRPADDIPSESELQERDEQRHYVHPEYFFTIKVEGVEYGRERESGLLRFRDGYRVTLTNADGTPAVNEDYVLHLADGTQRSGTLDSSGQAIERGLPPGEVRVEFPNRCEQVEEGNDWLDED